jgi:3',5'-cyclic AMP phosphodiesterase CpdA
MRHTMDRREFLGLAALASAGIAGAVVSSGLPGARAAARKARADEFLFLQMSDVHWGFEGAAVNPDAGHTFEKAVASVNALARQPDFVVFTGDLTHTTDDAGERRARMKRFREIASGLRAKTVRFMPGEHDASLDAGEAYREHFGETHYTFDHGGLHFVALDNVSDPTGSLGDAQIAWLKKDLARRDREQPIVVLTHRPLFDLYPQWDWATRDGAAAIEALTPFEYVTVFYGHIHQAHHHTTGHIVHHAAKSLIFPLPAPGSVPKKAPIPWDAAKPYDGLGFRTVQARRGAGDYPITERPVVEA